MTYLHKIESFIETNSDALDEIINKTQIKKTKKTL